MNFVYFLADEMRAESVSAYGNKAVRMPSYDRLSSEGTLFEQCHIQIPVCSPSRCCLFSGLYAHDAGHRTLWHLLRPHEKSLFYYLDKHGYEIAMYGKNDVYTEECLERYVDDLYIDTTPHNNGAPIYPKGSPGSFSLLQGPKPGTLADTGDGKCVARAVDFIRSRKRGDRPFFLYLPLVMPHPAYSAPEPWHSMYRAEDMPALRPRCEGKPSYHYLIPETRQLEGFDGFRKLHAVYLGMLSAVDALLGQVLDALSESALEDETTVIVSSDHGDYAGDYGLVEKWPSGLEDCLTRVPLVIRTPGGAKGHRVRTLNEGFDVMSTVLELAGIKEEHTCFSRSLVPELMGGEGDSERAVFAEGGYNTNERHCFEGHEGRCIPPEKQDPDYIYYPKWHLQQTDPESVCKATMIRTSGYKLIYRARGVSELYDLRADPYELHNLYRDEALKDVRDSLLMRLLSWLQDTSDTVPWDEDC